MFARFTPEARQACNLAGLEAIALGSPVIGTEHLLLGLLNSDPAAAALLREESVDTAAIKLELGSQGSAPGSTATYSDNALEALRNADGRAGNDLIGLGHLWFGILADDENGAVEVLHRLGVAKSVLQPAARAEAVQGIVSRSAVMPLLVNLCELAEEGSLAPAVGREAETRQVMETLLRWQKSTPVLVGDPGVGKTAIVEGLAWKLSRGEVPPPLRGLTLWSLDVGSLVAGTRYRGDLESRVRKLLDELTEDPEHILFIDELHTVLGAGGAEGQLDVGGLLKPALARGNLRMVAATTSRDYERYLARDPAFERRLHPVTVSEPSESETMVMLQVISERLEEHHGITIEKSALKAALRLSARYLPERRLPDKAVDVLDQAASASALQQSGVVDRQAVAQVMAGWTGIPSGRLNNDERQELEDLSRRLARRIIDQPEACEVVARALRRARVGIAYEGRPLGSFLFCGPTGVGKTELARALAVEVFGSLRSMVRFDMSEYHEASSAARLIGSAPGYIGHEEGGQLVNALRRTPYCVLVLDEIEKAHPSVINLLLQALEEGQLSDGRGRVADLSNVVVILTSNLGSKWASHSVSEVGFASEPQAETRHRKIKEEVSQFFAPELLGRLDEVVFFPPLSDEAMEKVAALLLDDLAHRLARQGVKMRFSKALPRWVAGVERDPALGARPLKGVIRQMVEDRLVDLMVAGELSEGDAVYLGVRSRSLTVRVY